LSGNNNQRENAIAIGFSAGQQTQGQGAVAIGKLSGSNSQGVNAIAIGKESALNYQGSYSIAIGFASGQNTQGQGAVAIGQLSGNNNQGVNAVAIGSSAGRNSQPANSIVLNARGSDLNGSYSSATYIAPMRRADETGFTSGNGQSLMLYNYLTGELGYSSSSNQPSNKTFVIDHPDDAERYLVHACLEGPEAGVYYRGEGIVGTDGHVVVSLPSYASSLASSWTIQLTPIGSNSFARLSCSRVCCGEFVVYGTPGEEFFWLCHGSRCAIDVEPQKGGVVVRGDGPYRWI